MRDGQEFRLPDHSRDQLLWGRVTWKVYTAEAVYWSCGAWPRSLLSAARQYSLGCWEKPRACVPPRILILAEGICLVQGHASLPGDNSHLKLEVQRPNPFASIQDISEGLSEPQSFPKICWGCCHICFMVQPPSAQFCFLHSLNRALTRNLLTGKSLFQSLFPGKRNRHQSLTEVVSGSKI